MQVIYGDGQRVPIKAWIDGVELEDAAREQLLQTANLPFVFKHVAVMPDVHWGMGATVGSVVATKGAIVPAAVGVDIGCGMVALRTALTADDLPVSLAPIRAAIEERVPVGGPGLEIGAHKYRAVPQRITDALTGSGLMEKSVELFAKHPQSAPQKARDTIEQQCGTLGTGNHFIEICLDEEQRIWIMLHSGSRGVGNRIGTYFIEQAQKQAKRYGYDVYLPNKDLAWLNDGTELFGDYWRSVLWAQDYAKLNREMMLAAVIDALQEHFPKPVTTDEIAVNCHHNYVAKESHFEQNVFVTRKGAVRAREGDLGIIPGSMGVRSYIVRGKGSKESFHSCSHGAGRRMSRGAAKKRFSVEDHIAATEGVECRKDAGVIDETPGAYKDIDAVIAAESDLIEVVHTLKQVVCVKG